MSGPSELASQVMEFTLMVLEPSLCRSLTLFPSTYFHQADELMRVADKVGDSFSIIEAIVAEEVRKFSSRVH